MKKVTKQQQAKLKKLDGAINMAINNIFHCAPNKNTPFAECFKLADSNLRNAYDTAIYEREKFESELIGEGRGWRNKFGHFYSF